MFLLALLFGNMETKKIQSIFFYYFWAYEYTQTINSESAQWDLLKSGLISYWQGVFQKLGGSPFHTVLYGHIIHSFVDLLLATCVYHSTRVYYL